jgi:hypothetical protein
LRSDGLSVLRWRSGWPWPRMASEKRMAAVLAGRPVRPILGGDLFTQFFGEPSHGILEVLRRPLRPNRLLQTLQLLPLAQPVPSVFVHALLLSAKFVLIFPPCRVLLR